MLYVFTANLTGHVEKVGRESFALLKVLGTGGKLWRSFVIFLLVYTYLTLFVVTAYGKVFLVQKICGHDQGRLYAMKVLKKASIVAKPKTAEHTMTERQVNEHSSVTFCILAKRYLCINEWSEKRSKDNCSLLC